ncbi:Hypothetical predicted protein [Mytilus galloprovincialis]|uniref:Uncharacterized protein n=1 Tax=Mytilus galloprovincialis TaxID=29158 RepID=A0A8B6G4Y5_MYTGA|nr:Hypothetical predicted protein [Mytilus galloprovincialis]
MASGQRLFLLTIVALKTLGLVIENTFTTPNNGKLNLFQVADFLQYVVDINQYGLDLGGITTLTFEAKACRDANTIMSNSDNGNSSKPIYEFIIGGWAKSKISYSKTE